MWSLLHRRESLVVALVLSSTLMACTSVQSVRDSAAPGFVHRFAVSYQQVLEATPASLAAVRLSVLETDDSVAGRRVIMARHGLSYASWGEYVRVIVTQIDAGHTDVAVLTKGREAVSATKYPDFYGDLLLEIGKRVLGT